MGMREYSTAEINSEIRNDISDKKNISLRNFYYSTLIAAASIVGTIAQFANKDVNESVIYLNFMISLPFFAFSLYEAREYECLSRRER